MKTINPDILNGQVDLTGQLANGTTQSRVVPTGNLSNRILVRTFGESNREIWDKFVLSNANSSFFHLAGWKDVVEQSFGHTSHYMIAIQEEQITGILPIFEIKSRLFGHSLVSVPFGVYGGVCSMNSNAEDSLMRSAAVLGRLIGVDYIEMRNQFDQLTRSPVNQLNELKETNWPTGKQDNRQTGKLDNWITKDLYVTFQREIYSDSKENFKAIPRKQRRMIRQGIKADLISKIGRREHLKDFYNIYARSVKTLGTPVFPLRYFENIMNIFSETFILSVWKDNMMVSGVMTFKFKNRLMPYYGGALEKYFQYAVNDFMYWELMRYGCENGFKVFDFGRSKKGTGSFDFKRHWGFEPTELPYMYCLAVKKDMPNISPANPKYNAMINIWKKLPLSVANWLGPKIVRSIP